MSRSTFREQVDVCWQKQLRDKYMEEGTPPVPHLDVGRARVRPVSRKLAEQIILKYEWLGTMSTTSLHYGLFFGPFCAGVTCVSSGAAMAGAYHHRQFGISREGLLTLARGACVHWCPSGGNSKLVAWTARMLSRQGAGKLLWATSDTDAGEIGTIYQACGWAYIGLGGGNRPDAEMIAPNGRSVNRRMLSTYAAKWRCNTKQAKERLLDNGWTMQPSNPKHRYVYVIDKKDKALVARIERMRQPYPKRADEATQ